MGGISHARYLRNRLHAPLELFAEVPGKPLTRQHRRHWRLIFELRATEAKIARYLARTGAEAKRSVGKNGSNVTLIRRDAPNPTELLRLKVAGKSVAALARAHGMTPADVNCAATNRMEAHCLARSVAE